MKADFDGKTYEPTKDQKRLGQQLSDVIYVMTDGEWHTLREIQQACLAHSGHRHSEAGISARLRDLRKERTHELLDMVIDVDRRRESGGLYSYKLIV
jgi:hypothetical protein